MNFDFKSKNKDAEIENYELKISLEFGENFGKDISERLFKKFSEINQNQIEFYNNLTKQINSDCWNVIDANSEQITNAELENLLENKVFKKYSWINTENKKRILSQFSYFFWKDGILK